MPRNRTKNTPIGSAPCPFKDCDLIGQVFRFRQQSENANLTRRAGRLYMRCTDHGMTQDQNWLAEHATITDQEHGRSDATQTPDETTTSAPEKAREPKPAADDKPDTVDAAAPDNDDDDGWGFFK